MISYMIYRPGYGNSDLYLRRRKRVSGVQNYWNFSTSAWVTSESAATKIFLTEVADSTFSSVYSLTSEPAATPGSYTEEVVQTTTGDILQQNLPPVATTSEDYSGVTLQTTLDLVLQRAAQLRLVAKMPFMNAANLALEVIYKRLLTKRSDLVRGAFTRSITEGVNSCTVPTDFAGLSERPYFTGTTVLLEPLPPEHRMLFTTNGTPRYYELRGTTLYLYPTPSQNYTLNCTYYQKQATVALLSDAVPFNGMIDYTLLDAVLKICEGGLAVLADPVFRQALYSQLEELLPFRAPRQVSFFGTVERSRRTGGHPDYWGNI